MYKRVNAAQMQPGYRENERIQLIHTHTYTQTHVHTSMHMFASVLSLTLYFPSDPFPNLTYFRVVFQRRQYAFIICSRIFPRYNISIISGRHSSDFSGGSLVLPGCVLWGSDIPNSSEASKQSHFHPRFVCVVPRWWLSSPC